MNLSPAAEALVLDRSSRIDGRSVGQSRAEVLTEIVRNWHCGAHDGPWQGCREQPCYAIQRVA